MTGFEWTIIGAGPDPRLGGKLNALTYVVWFGQILITNWLTIF
jgi:hypothetical protein